MGELTKEQQDMVKALETKRDELTAGSILDNEQASIYSTLAHDKLVIRDELQRQIDVIVNGEKRVTPLTISDVTAQIQASKNVVNGVIGEPIIK